jgi:hypothetical protein
VVVFELLNDAGILQRTFELIPANGVVNTSIDLSSLPSGLYIVRLVDGGNVHVSRLFIP